MSDVLGVEAIFERSPPVTGRRGRLITSRRRAGLAAAAAAGVATLFLTAILILL